MAPPIVLARLCYDQGVWFHALRPVLKCELCFVPLLKHRSRWSAAEIRRKSFKELHTLWYVVLREKDLPETRLLEVSRLGALQDMTSVKKHIFRVNPRLSKPGSCLSFVLCGVRKQWPVSSKPSTNVGWRKLCRSSRRIRNMRFSPNENRLPSERRPRPKNARLLLRNPRSGDRKSHKR